MKKRLHYLAATIAVSTLLTTHSVQAETAADKFGRGLAGMACGFLEVPGNIYQETKMQGAVGIPVGLAKGLGMFVSRELVGAYEFVTAPFPYPADFRPIMQPEYPWDYFEQRRAVQ